MVKYVRNVKRARITRWWGCGMCETISSEPISLEPGVAALSAETLHRTAMEAFRVGNRGKLTLCTALRVIDEQRKHLELGFSTVAGHARAHFGYRRTETYGAIRVARALEGLPECTRAFAEGRVGWSKLRVITRIATPESEGEWLSFAAAHTVEEVEAEVRDGMAKKRDRPREDRLDLPNLEQRLLLKCTRSEMEKIRLGLERLQEELAAKLGGDDIALRDLLPYACERLAAGGTAKLDARAGEGALPYAVVYHRCPDCGASGMWTGEGLRWKAAATAFDRDLPARTAGALPVIQLPSGDPDKGTVSGRPDESPASGYPDGAPPLPQDVTRDVIRALKKHFGFDKETARRDLLRAAAELPAGRCSEQDLIQAALGYRRERNRAPVQRARDVRVAPHPHLPAHVHRAGRPRRPVAALF
jgi:hypothetical protein